MQKQIFTPNGQLLTEILNGGTIISSYSNNERVTYVLLQLHKNRIDYNRQKTINGDMFIPKYVSYQCMEVNGEWNWYAMTYYRCTQAEAIKGLRQQYREDVRSKQIEA